MTRIYSVANGGDFHLVEASTKSAALRHVAERSFEVKVADQKTLVAAIKDGVAVEKAGKPAAEEGNAD